MKNNLIYFWKWFKTTSTLVGMPVLLIVCLVGSQKMFFTASCHSVGWKCEYAFGSTDMMADYMGELLAANPDMDIVTKRRSR